jgi:hypothetical protein
MSTMISEVYDAFIASRVPEDKARAAAVALTEFRYRDLVTKADLTLAVSDLRTEMASWQPSDLNIWFHAERTGLGADHHAKPPTQGKKSTPDETARGQAPRGPAPEVGARPRRGHRRSIACTRASALRLISGFALRQGFSYVSASR